MRGGIGIGGIEVWGFWWVVNMDDRPDTGPS